MGGKYNCFVFALGLEKDQDFTFQDNIPPSFNINGLIMEKFLSHFTETKNPEKGNLVIYRDKNHYISHASIFLNNEKAMSIWMEKESVPSKKLILEEKKKYGDETFYSNPKNFNPCAILKTVK